MMEYAKRVAVRRVVYLLIAAVIGLAASLFSGRAEAQQIDPSCYGRGVGGQCPDLPTAKDAISKLLDEQLSGNWIKCWDVQSDGLRVDGWVSPPGCHGRSGGYYRWVAVACPAGQVFNSATKSCRTLCDAGEIPDPENPGQCLNAQKCLDKNVGQQGIGSRPWKSACISGCQLEWQDDGSASSKKTTLYNANGTVAADGVIYTGKFQYSGALCPAENPPPGLPPEKPEDDAEPSENECVPLGNQTACVKPNGNICAQASTGREICWSPHETGSKSDQQYMQTKTPGENPTPQALGLPNGDTAEKVKDDFKMKQETSGQASVTTVSTYATNSGANAGVKNEGQKQGENQAPGGGGTGDANGNGVCDEGETCDEETAGGGGDCETEPTVSGDPGEQMIAVQAWRTRCEIEQSKKDISNETADLKGQNDGMEGGLEAGQGWTTGDGNLAINTGLLGGGSGACPAPPVINIGGRPFAWPAGFCQALALIRLLVIAVAYVAGALMLLGGRRG